MNVTPKGDPKVIISQEGTISSGLPGWLDFLLQTIVGIYVWAIILNRPQWIEWLRSWLPGY